MIILEFPEAILKLAIFPLFNRENALKFWHSDEACIIIVLHFHLISDSHLTGK